MELNWLAILSGIGSLNAAYVFFAVKSPDRYLAIHKLVYRWVMTLIALGSAAAIGAQVASAVVFTALQPLSPLQEKAFEALPFLSMVGVACASMVAFSTADLVSYLLVSAVKEHERANPKIDK